MIRLFGEALREAQRNPIISDPDCQECAYHDQFDMCSRWVNAITGAQTHCEEMRNLGGPCGVTARGFRPGGYDSVSPADYRQGACISCAHNFKDSSEFLLDDTGASYFCTRYTTADGLPGLCHELRLEGGACGSDGIGWRSALETDDFIIGDGVR